MLHVEAGTSLVGIRTWQCGYTKRSRVLSDAYVQLLLRTQTTTERCSSDNVHLPGRRAAPTCIRSFRLDTVHKANRHSPPS